jgi:sulfur relay (sulfurtransferase) complex TusBCD TusD component (DsrE family)
MENIILKFIGQNIKGVDTYQHNGSTWLIFTDEKKWVIELTKDGTLWYNYNFFNSIFSFFSLDVIENQHYITKWVEDAIQNGVRNTNAHNAAMLFVVEDAIQNGVKNTLPEKTTCSPHLLEDIVQNGVKRTCNTSIDMESIQHTIQNGIKNTEPGGYLGPITIRGKVFHQFESSNQTDNVGNVIQNGVKETKAMDEAVFQGVKY